jgi:hypothetical protein
MRPALIGTALALVLVSRPALTQIIEYNSDRFGSDIAGADFQLRLDGKPIDCVNACNKNTGCRAWAFLHPYYFSGDKHPYCKLKYAVPPRVDNPRTDSGVKSEASCYACDLRPPSGGQTPPASSSTVTSWDAIPKPDEQTLTGLINEYRMQNGLAAIRTSPALTKVAQLHVQDLVENQPDRGVDQRGVPCNGHSWSNKGNWSPVCYTGDHLYAQSMWSKPREIANYPGSGFEIAYGSSDGQPQPEAALSGWKSSPAHNDVILERGIWANKNWPAFGVGMYKGYAVVWFGDVAQ